MVSIIDIILIAVGLSMDAFALSISYGIYNISKNKMIITSIIVGIYHFFMPLFGNVIGIELFKRISLKPNMILFFIFLYLSLDMIINFFEKTKLKPLTFIGIIVFGLTVSLDSLTVGLGLTYIYSNILVAVCVFCMISTLFTLFGFLLGKFIHKTIGKYAFLFGGLLLFIYSIFLLTK